MRNSVFWEVNLIFSKKKIIRSPGDEPAMVLRCVERESERKWTIIYYYEHAHDHQMNMCDYENEDSCVTMKICIQPTSNVKFEWFATSSVFNIKNTHTSCKNYIVYAYFHSILKIEVASNKVVKALWAILVLFSDIFSTMYNCMMP